MPLRISSCTTTRIAGYSTRRPKDSGRGTALRPIAGRRTARARGTHKARRPKNRSHSHLCARCVESAVASGLMPLAVGQMPVQELPHRERSACRPESARISPRHAGCLLRRNRGPVRPMLVAEASVRPSCPGTGDLGRSTVFDIRGVSVERRTREIGSMGLRSPRAAATSGQWRKSARTGRGGRGSAAGALPGLRRVPLLSRLAGQAPVRVVLDPRSPMDDRVSVRPCRARWRSSCRVSGRTGCRSTRLMTDYWSLLWLGVSA